MTVEEYLAAERASDVRHEYYAGVVRPMPSDAQSEPPRMTAAVKRTTLDEYLAAERASDIRHEYYAGVVTAMAGASFRHNLITGNIVGECRRELGDRRCFVLPSDMRVRTRSTLFAYPDVVIVCGTPEFEGDREDTLLNPTVVIEVLSESTEAYDRGDKFAHYRSIASLTEYVLVAQDRMRVEHFVRQPDGRWLFSESSGPEAAIAFPALDVSLPLAGIYANVEFPPQPPLLPGGPEPLPAD
ncbi:MAG: Uma2 family endonuclease [Planctomyces sp.]|nr:Uma2 family endonuclease [Planctomyces sp.]